MKNHTLKYFLASNSCEGFVSFFEISYDPQDEWRVFIIKGGPGTGKSSFMKKCVKYAEEKGENAILCPCSSDPDSLDGVIFENTKIIILDGTSPHTLDPKYPAVCEEILNFGQFWDDRKIENKSQVIEVTDQNKALHKTASKYLKATGQIMLDNYITALSCTQKDKVKNFADRLCKKYIPSANDKPKEWLRFLEGITPQGVISYPETLENLENLIIFSDNTHASSNIFMNCVRDFALINGYEIITIKNAFLPTIITDHIIIPELSTGFVTETKSFKILRESRRIHARRFTSNKLLHNSLARIKINQKVANSLLNSACNTLKHAKSVHDTLESFYIKSMDFEKLNNFADMFCKNYL